MQHETADKEMKFFKIIRYYKTTYKTYIKDDFDHANVITLQEKTQDQSAQRNKASKSQNDSKNNLKKKTITTQKRKQENVYVKTFMSIKNVSTSFHQLERLIKQKIKRYAIKSNNCKKSTIELIIVRLLIKKMTIV